MSTLAFSKMHGTGNDFMVVDATQNNFVPTKKQLRLWSDRRFGIGFDQLLLVETSARVDFRYRIFNADGSEVEQCGNGARCFVKFVRDVGLTDKTCLQVETINKDITLTMQDDGQVQVNMGTPVFTPAQIPLDASEEQNQYPVHIDGETYEFYAVSMGNPHAVFVVDDVEHFPVTTIGAQVETHPMFPNRVNAGFMQILSRDEIKLRVFERGAGETLACGSGACAAVVSGIKAGLLEHSVIVHVLGGRLEIFWDGAGSVRLTGGATTVFQGEISI